MAKNAAARELARRKWDGKGSAKKITAAAQELGTLSWAKRKRSRKAKEQIKDAAKKGGEATRLRWERINAEKAQQAEQ